MDIIIVRIVGLSVSSSDIMDFLDKYPRVKFKVSDIREQMIILNYRVPTYRNMLNSMRMVVKWDDYECEEYINNTGHKVKLYRRI